MTETGWNQGCGNERGKNTRRILRPADSPINLIKKRRRNEWIKKVVRTMRGFNTTYTTFSHRKKNFWCRRKKKDSLWDGGGGSISSGKKKKKEQLNRVPGGQGSSGSNRRPPSLKTQKGCLETGKPRITSLQRSAPTGEEEGRKGKLRFRDEVIGEYETSDQPLKKKGSLNFCGGGKLTPREQCGRSKRRGPIMKTIKINRPL